MRSTALALILPLSAAAVWTSVEVVGRRAPRAETPALAPVPATVPVAAPVAVPVAVPAARRAVASPVIAAHDFNDGTFGPFTNDTPGHNSIVDDPTRSGHGKVVRISYRGSAPDGAIDLNQYFSSPVGGHGYGKTFFAAGDVYFPTTTLNLGDPRVLRKLFYFRVNDAESGQTTNLVLLMLGNQLMINWSGPSFSINSPEALAAITPGRWSRIEMQTTMNSAPTAEDGIIRLWVDGALVYSTADVKLTEPTWRSPRWKSWWVGHQREGNHVETSVDEERYWDNVVFSTSPIGPSAPR